MWRVSAQDGDIADANTKANRSLIFSLSYARNDVGHETLQSQGVEKMMNITKFVGSNNWNKTSGYTFNQNYCTKK